MEKKNRSIIWATVLAFILLLIDQITKFIIVAYKVNIVVLPNILSIETIQNRGGAFGVAQGNTGMFIITNVVVLGLIIRFIYLQKNYMDKSTLFMLFAILAGGFGNLIDRIFRGYVVDFINILPTLDLPKFNCADAYITLGWVCLAFLFAKYTYQEIKNSKNKGEEDA